jgi:hypothetical protein
MQPTITVRWHVMHEKTMIQSGDTHFVQLNGMGAVL